MWFLKSFRSFLRSWFHIIHRTSTCIWFFRYFFYSIHSISFKMVGDVRVALTTARFQGAPDTPPLSPVKLVSGRGQTAVRLLYLFFVYQFLLFVYQTYPFYLSSQINFANSKSSITLLYCLCLTPPPLKR